mgnify:CR=1 FL=1
MYRIIIADDGSGDERMRRYLLALKKNRAAEIVHVNAEQLLNLLDTLEPDIIISDISMPEKTGLDVLKEINKRKLKTKVILAQAQESVYPYIAVI